MTTKTTTNLLLSLFLTLTVAVAVCRADTSVTSFYSGDGVGEYNELTGSNVLITPHPSWGSLAGAKWVSALPTGFGDPCCIGNDPLYPPPTLPWAFFHETFDTTAAVTDLYLSALADDTAFIWVDNVLLVDASQPMLFTPQIVTRRLGAGEHDVVFGLEQLGLGQTGLAYAGTLTVTTDASPVPEPRGMGLAALGLIGLLAMIAIEGNGRLDANETVRRFRRWLNG